MAKIVVEGTPAKIEAMKKLLRNYGVTFSDVSETPVYKPTHKKKKSA